MTRPTKRTAGLSIAAAAGVLVLAGCGSGLHPQTYEARAAANSTNVDSGPLSVRHVYVPAPGKDGYAIGANADVVLSAATRAGTEDRLVSATSADAASVEVPDGLVVPVNGLLLDARITLTGLKKIVRSSDYVDLQLTFSSGATVTVNTPVEADVTPPDTRPDFEVPETDSNGDPIVHSEDTAAESPTELGAVEP